jgi:hypothetical protein
MIRMARPEDAPARPLLASRLAHWLAPSKAPEAAPSPAGAIKVAAVLGLGALGGLLLARALVRTSSLSRRADSSAHP